MVAIPLLLVFSWVIYRVWGDPVYFPYDPLPQFTLEAEPTETSGGNHFYQYVVGLDTSGSTNVDDILEDDPSDVNTPFYKVFLSFGDGNYFIGKKSDLDTLRYNYPALSSYQRPYIEMAAAYDKKKRKTTGRAVVPGEFNPFPSANPGKLKPTLQNNDVLAVIPARDPRYGELMTYVVSYKNDTGDAFTPDAKLKISYSAQFDTVQETTGNPNRFVDTFFNETHSFSGDTLVINVGNTPARTQRNVFIHFIPGAPEYDRFGNIIFDSVAVSAELINDNELLQFKQVFNTMLDSHDPNQKTVTKEYCQQPRDRSVEFMVKFQNEGAGLAGNIIIRDEIDALLELNSVDVTDWDPKFESIVHTIDATRREVIFKIKPKKPIIGRGSDAYKSVEETIGWLKFSARVKKAMPCNAVCNSARIFFDCQAPVSTNTVFARLPCDRDCKDTCSTTDIVNVIERRLRSGVSGSIWPNNDSLLTQIESQGFTSFKWYPSTGLDSPFTLNPLFTPTRSTRYVLVASKSCERWVIRFDVKVDCGFDFTYSIVPDCSGGHATIVTTPEFKTKRYNKDVAGTSLVWSNCSSGDSGATFKNRSPGAHFISLLDTVTGCFVEKKIYIPVYPIRVEDDSTDCEAKLTISGGAEPYTFKWTKDGKDANETGSYMDLSGAKASVTVTDVNGCTAVFTPVSKGTCIPWWWWAVAVVVAVPTVVAAASKSFRERVNNLFGNAKK